MHSLHGVRQELPKEGALTSAGMPEGKALFRTLFGNRRGDSVCAEKKNNLLFAMFAAPVILPGPIASSSFADNPKAE